MNVQDTRCTLHTTKNFQSDTHSLMHIVHKKSLSWYFQIELLFDANKQGGGVATQHSSFKNKAYTEFYLGIDIWIWFFKCLELSVLISRWKRQEWHVKVFKLQAFKP
jgi:hypothetical protein